MNFENMMVSERSQSQKATLYIFNICVLYGVSRIIVVQLLGCIRLFVTPRTAES